LKTSAGPRAQKIGTIYWCCNRRLIYGTFTITVCFSIGFLIAYAVTVSWQEAVGLIISAFVVSLVFTLIPDHFAMWVIGTLAIYPLMVSVVMTGWRL
jgi:hypothetical protein